MRIELILGLFSTTLLAIATPTRKAPNPVAHLSYGNFSGAFDQKLNITYWRRIPFAAPPLGQNRFGAPQAPVVVQDDVYDSNRAFSTCTHATGGSEDCLYLGLYSRPWTNTTAKRPVVVFFHGGGFIRGGGSFGLPPSGYPTLNVSVENDFILIYPNYRVNAFGFLPGKRVRESPTSVLNAALLDQRFALKWVHEHISSFGGDPDNVAIWGQSAGGGAVIAQVLSATAGPTLFNKAMLSSPYWPKTYRYDSQEAEAIYDEMVALTGCSNVTDSMQCLKEVDAQKIQAAAMKMNDEHKYTTSSYTWAPVIDGSFLVESLSAAAKHRRLKIDRVFGMYNAHEGENFVPPGLRKGTNSAGFNSSAASFDHWLRGFLPSLNSTLLDEVKSLYPATGVTETFSFNNSYERAGVIYRDAVLTCPELWVTKAASKPGSIGEYTIVPAKHASDTGYWNSVNVLQTRNRRTYTGFASALANFFQTGDPNAGRIADAAAIPNVQSGKEWLVEEGGFGSAGAGSLETKCAFWQRVGDLVPV